MSKRQKSKYRGMSHQHEGQQLRVPGRIPLVPTVGHARSQKEVITVNPNIGSIIQFGQLGFWVPGFVPGLQVGIEFAEYKFTFTAFHEFFSADQYGRQYGLIIRLEIRQFETKSSRPGQHGSVQGKYIQTRLLC